MSQQTEVIDYCLSNQYITSMDAYAKLGITQLAARIFELERMGWEFDREFIPPNKATGAKKYTKYKLKVHLVQGELF